jgi:enoyl-CoA hydratase
MAEQLLATHEADGIALLTLNRPEKRNALSRALRDEIVRCLDELAKTDGVRVAILTGAGTAFSAGFDRTEFAGGNMVEVFLQSLAYHRRVYTFEKPLIAAVNGSALGGGCDLAAMCDIRLAATTAVFGQPQIRFGAPAAYDLIRAVIGAGAAREMCVTGRTYSAQEALAIGLVSHVVEPSQLLEKAKAIAREITALPEGMAETIKRTFLAEQPTLFEAPE